MPRRPRSSSRSSASSPPTEGDEKGADIPERYRVTGLRAMGADAAELAKNTKVVQNAHYERSKYYGSIYKTFNNVRAPILWISSAGGVAALAAFPQSYVRWISAAGLVVSGALDAWLQSAKPDVECRTHKDAGDDFLDLFSKADLLVGDLYARLSGGDVDVPGSVREEFVAVKERYATLNRKYDPPGKAFWSIGKKEAASDRAHFKRMKSEFLGACQ